MLTNGKREAKTLGYLGDLSTHSQLPSTDINHGLASSLLLLANTWDCAIFVGYVYRVIARRDDSLVKNDSRQAIIGHTRVSRINKPAVAKLNHCVV